MFAAGAIWCIPANAVSVSPLETDVLPNASKTPETLVELMLVAEVNKVPVSSGELLSYLKPQMQELLLLYSLFR